MWRVDGGSQTIALKLAASSAAGPAELARRGGSCRTAGRDGRLGPSDGEGQAGDRRGPAGARGADRLRADPPVQRDQLTQRYGQGTLTKVAAVYDRPFWRDQGLTGQAITTGGPVSATFDDSPPDGSLGMIFGFVGGDKARVRRRCRRPPDSAAVLSQYASFFGSQASSPREYFETMWAGEQWTRGCPVGIPATGALYAYGAAMRDPVGRIHWAGTETSTYWNGYMDGAVRSGERVAAEVQADL